MKVSQQHYEIILNGIKAMPYEDLIKYRDELKENGNYKNFETRLTWDILHSIKHIDLIVNNSDDIKNVMQYFDTYNDDHIETAGRKALKKLNIL